MGCTPTLYSSSWNSSLVSLSFWVLFGISGAWYLRLLKVIVYFHSCFLSSYSLWWYCVFFSNSVGLLVGFNSGLYMTYSLGVSCLLFLRVNNCVPFWLFQCFFRVHCSLFIVYLQWCRSFFMIHLRVVEELPSLYNFSEGVIPIQLKDCHSNSAKLFVALSFA